MEGCLEGENSWRREGRLPGGGDVALPLKGTARMGRGVDGQLWMEQRTSCKRDKWKCWLGISVDRRSLGREVHRGHRKSGYHTCWLGFSSGKKGPLSNRIEERDQGEQVGMFCLFLRITEDLSGQRIPVSWLLCQCWCSVSLWSSVPRV